MMRAPKSLDRPHRLRAGAALAAILVAALPVAAQARPAPPAAPSLSFFQAELLKPGNADLRRFYFYRANRPLWVADGALSPAALELGELIASAEVDGIRPEDVHAAALEQALGRARSEGTAEALEAAELALSRSFTDYVRLTLATPEGGMLYEHVSLQPQVPEVATALQKAAASPSLADYIHTMGWMHPLYAPLRRAVAQAGAQDRTTAQVYRTNLARIRALPAVPPGGRYVLVNAAAARLWMYEGTTPVDSMKVVVGRLDHQTPIMSGYIRYAIVNPYWNIPGDFTRDRIAPRVLAQGLPYLRRGGYQVMSDWTQDAAVVDPAMVDWRAVAAGDVNLRVRQLPGSANSMGKVKFEFPNALGIYLHDTPETQLMAKDARQFSSGCVRLEDAQRLGRWLFKGAMPSGEEVEQRFDLPAVVPVYVTYLTVQPGSDGHIAMLGDPYGRDRASAPAVALKDGPALTSR